MKYFYVSYIDSNEKTMIQQNRKQERPRAASARLGGGCYAHKAASLLTLDCQREYTPSTPGPDKSPDTFENHWSLTSEV